MTLSVSRQISFFILLFFSLPAFCQQENDILLDKNWQFLRSDLGSIWEAVRPELGSTEAVPLWTDVTLPHSYNAEDAVDPDVNYYQGPAWYKTQIKIENPYKEGRTILHFEGAGQKTEVYVFMEKAGSHIGGYDEWSVDITDAVRNFKASEAFNEPRFNGKIPISIRTDNSRDTEMIPSDLADFNLYGGIYRNLTLQYRPALSIDHLFATAQVDSRGDKGVVDISAIFYDHSESSSAEVQLSIFAPDKKNVFDETIPVEEFTGEVSLKTLNIDAPALWSTDSPELYTLRAKLISGTGTHEKIVRFGFRHFEFSEEGPFYLNGERLLLKGTHRHEDHAGVGPAMTEDMRREELILMKNMGVNFLRSGHYQMPETIIDLCDSLGILVWEEIPWCRGGLGGSRYKEQARRMLTNMIMQHRNHPSVIIWGLGNENDWPNDFPEFDKDKISSFMEELHELSHDLDSTRKTAIRRCAFCRDIVDVYSPSIWAGWYRGRYTDYKRVSENERQYGNRFLHVEWGGDSHARRHTEDPLKNLDAVESGKKADERAGDAALYGGKARASKDGEWTETYICDLIDWHLKEQETMDWLSGTAQWVFKDFSTPVRPGNPVPYVNQKGVVERDLTPKEAYYVFQSYWTEKPMVHIYGHTWPVRWGEKNEKKLVRIYSNCDKVELFLNGESMGVKNRDSQKFPAAGLSWNIPLKEGENQFKAIGKKGEITVTDEIVQHYQTSEWGDVSQINVHTYQAGEGFIWVEAQLTDDEGVKCLDARDYIYFELAGDGELIDNLGTSDGSRKVQAYNGRARIKVRLNNGISSVAVKSPEAKTKFIKVQ